MEDRLIADLKEIVGKEIERIKISRDYSALGLRFNPFPPAAVPRYPHLGPLDEGTMETVRKFVLSTYSRREDNTYGEFAGLTIVGDYGMGKTHLMHHIILLIELLNERVEEFSAVTCFVDRPEDSPERVIHRIVEQIGLDALRKYLWLVIIERLAKNNTSEFLAKYKFPQPSLQPIRTEQWQKLFKEPARSNPLEFLSRFRDLNGNMKRLQDDARQIIREEAVPDDLLADRYMSLLFPEKETDATWDILAGYVASKDTRRKETQFLNSIVTILRKNGFNILYVFIDEFEDIAKLKGTRLTNYLLTLNTLINSERRWAVVVSLTQEVLNRIKKESPPLYDRLISFQINLGPLDVKKAKELIINYLNIARDPKSDISPFTEQSIEKMVQMSQGNYRSFIRLASKAIETAVDKGKKPPIDETTLG